MLITTAPRCPNCCKSGTENSKTAKIASRAAQSHRERPREATPTNFWHALEAHVVQPATKGTNLDKTL